MRPVDISRKRSELVAKMQSNDRHYLKEKQLDEAQLRWLQEQCPHERREADVGTYWHIQRCADCGAEVE